MQSKVKKRQNWTNSKVRYKLALTKTVIRAHCMKIFFQKNDLKFLFFFAIILFTSCNNSHQNLEFELIEENSQIKPEVSFSETYDNSFISQSFICRYKDSKEKFELDFLEDGSLIQTSRMESSKFGSYQFKNEKLHLSFPDSSIEETSLQLENQKDLFISLNFPKFDCSSSKHSEGKMIEAHLKCPHIKNTDNAGYQSNSFQFFGNGMVLRKTWNILPHESKNSYKESIGIYLIEQDSVFLAFGDKEKERILTGSIIDSYAMKIKELYPNEDLCE